MIRFATRPVRAFAAAMSLVLVACGGDGAGTDQRAAEEVQVRAAEEVPEEEMRSIREILDERMAQAAAELDPVPMGPDGCPPGYVEDVSAYADPLRDLDAHLRELQSQAPPGLAPDMSELQEMLGESIETYEQMEGMGVCVPEAPGEQPELTDEEALDYFCELMRDAAQNRPEDLDMYEVANPAANCGVRG